MKNYHLLAADRIEALRKLAADALKHDLLCAGELHLFREELKRVSEVLGMPGSPNLAADVAPAVQLMKDELHKERMTVARLMLRRGSEAQSADGIETIRDRDARAVMHALVSRSATCDEAELAFKVADEMARARRG